MGWFGYGPLDGDDGMDLRDEIFHMLKITDPKTYEWTKTPEEIGQLLEANQETLYDWLRDYDWDKRYNPGFIQEVYIQALAYLMVEYGAKINERGKPVFLKFIKNDHWAKSEKDRKKEMKKLYKKVEAA